MASLLEDAFREGRFARVADGCAESAARESARRPSSTFVRVGNISNSSLITPSSLSPTSPTSASLWLSISLPFAASSPLSVELERDLLVTNSNLLFFFSGEGVSFSFLRWRFDVAGDAGQGNSELEAFCPLFVVFGFLFAREEEAWFGAIGERGDRVRALPFDLALVVWARGAFRFDFFGFDFEVLEDFEERRPRGFRRGSSSTG